MTGRMISTCILTDELAQFVDLSFDGQDHVQLMPLHLGMDGGSVVDLSRLKATQMPHARTGSPPPSLIAPGVDAYVQAFSSIARDYSDILAVLPAGGLSESYHNASIAAEMMEGTCKAAVVDTGSVGVGLGVLVAAAAERAASGADVNEIKRDLLGISNEVYAVFSITNLAYLQDLSIATASQAIVGEMLDVQQLFYLNSGTLIPVQKIRNPRHMVESIVEFVAEFNDPQRVAIQQAATGFHQEARAIRERLNLEYESVAIHEMAPTVALAALFGPQSFGLFLWEFTA